MKKIIKKTLLVISITSALSGMTGCTALHSDYERPQLANYTFVNGTESKESVNTNIWECFNDDKLTYLINEAFVVNNDYVQAVITAKKAMLQADITDTNLIPDLSGNLRSSGSKELSGDSSFSKNASSGISLSYEIDLFGRLSAERKASAYSAEAALYDAKAARLTVAGTVAKIYWQIVYYKDTVRLWEDNLEDSKKTFDIMQDRYQNGDISELELVQAKRDYLENETSLMEAQTNLVNSISAMNVLLNRVPNVPVDTVASLKDIKVPNVRASISSDILKYRPDVAAAEAKVKSALASKDAAKLGMYPKFTLTAGIDGGKSGSLTEFFTNPVGSIAGMLSFPFLNYYQNSLNIDLASLSRDSAELTFVYTYYKALGETEDLLNNIDLYKVILQKDIEKLKLNKKSEELYLSQYETGKVALKDYLEARSLRRNTALNLCRDKQQQLNNVMGLGKSLGGF